MQYLMTYFTEFRKNAIEEIKKVDPEAVLTHIRVEFTLISTKMNGSIFIEALKKSQPIFIRHIMPIAYEMTLTNKQEKDLEMILNGVQSICNLQEKEYFSVQARIIRGTMDYNAKHVEVFVGEYYEERGSIPVFSDSTIINYDINIISIFINATYCYIGYSKAADNLNFHSDEYRVLGKETAEISRAENKLKEAISKFKIKVNGQGYALDVGAAPGGWTKVLADNGFKVCAVDPSQLHEALKDNKNIMHYKGHIEDIEFDHQFNLVTCDMNVDALITAKVMCQLHNKIIKDGNCIITLKLPFKDEDKRIRESVKILKEKFDIVAIKNLTHNRREVTVYMHPKAIN